MRERFTETDSDRDRCRMADKSTGREGEKECERGGFIFGNKEMEMEMKLHVNYG